MDITTITLPALMALGAVNVLTMIKPGIDSRIKFIASVVVAFCVTFIPAEISNLLLEKLKVALEVALSASGVYKLSQKVGGN